MFRSRLPGIPIERITPDVEPISGEEGRYFVRSRSNHRHQYLVDLFENGFVGKCDCPQFAMRIQRDIDRGINPNGNQSCYHLKRAERYFLELQKRAVWAVANRIRPRR